MIYSRGVAEKTREPRNLYATRPVVGTGIASLAVANAAVGLESKVAIHGAHHAFEFLGGARLAHIQVILWIAGQKGSDLSLRIPLPWK
jgi:hypothetical protein